MEIIAVDLDVIINGGCIDNFCRKQLDDLINKYKVNDTIKFNWSLGFEKNSNISIRFNCRCGHNHIHYFYSNAFKLSKKLINNTTLTIKLSAMKKSYHVASWWLKNTKYLIQHVSISMQTNKDIHSPTTIPKMKCSLTVLECSDQGRGIRKNLSVDFVDGQFIWNKLPFIAINTEEAIDGINKAISEPS